jgi:hypothetical protein
MIWHAKEITVECFRDSDIFVARFKREEPGERECVRNCRTIVSDSLARERLAQLVLVQFVLKSTVRSTYLRGRFLNIKADLTVSFSSAFRLIVYQPFNFTMQEIHRVQGIPDPPLRT